MNRYSNCAVKGFPREVEVNDEESLAAVEHLIIRLESTSNVFKSEYEELMTVYKKARMEYLDSLFVMDESNVNALQKASDVYLAAAQDVMDKVRLLEKSGLWKNRGCYLHFLIGNFIDGLSEREMLLLEAITQQLPSGIGMSYGLQIDDHSDNGGGGFCNGFMEMKKLLNLSWQDMLRISDYRLEMQIGA